MNISEDQLYKGRLKSGPLTENTASYTFNKWNEFLKWVLFVVIYYRKRPLINVAGIQENRKDRFLMICLFEKCHFISNAVFKCSEYASWILISEMGQNYRSKSALTFTALLELIDSWPAYGLLEGRAPPAAHKQEINWSRGGLGTPELAGWRSTERGVRDCSQDFYKREHTQRMPQVFQVTLMSHLQSKQRHNKPKDDSRGVMATCYDVHHTTSINTHWCIQSIPLIVWDRLVELITIVIVPEDQTKWNADRL